MDCVTNNCEYITTFKTVEIKQEEINSEYANKYRAALTRCKSKKVIMDIGLVNIEIEELENSTDFDNLTEKKKKVIYDKAKKLEAKKAKLENEYLKFSKDQEEITVMDEANNIMILGSIIGNFIEAGYIKKNGEEVDPTIEIVKGFTTQQKAKLLENAIKLYTAGEAEQGN